jgi:AcrR family transcriptional regulator
LEEIAIKNRPAAGSKAARAKPARRKQVTDTGKPKEWGRVQAKKDKKRRAILLASRKEFVRRGFSGARMESIAKAAKVAKGTLFLYFKSKDDLFEALIHDAVILEQARFKQMEGELPLQAIRRIVLEGALQGAKYEDLDHLIMTEGRRFPRLVNIYLRAAIWPTFEVLDKCLSACHSPRAAKFRKHPLLLIAPVYAASVWNRLLRVEPPVDLQNFISAYFDMLALVQDPDTGLPVFS